MTQFIIVKDSPPPKNGDLLLLLIRADEDNHPTEADDDVFITIGFNNGDDNGEDEWQCAGWNWCADEFVSTSGEILAWMPLPQKPSNLN